MKFEFLCDNSVVPVYCVGKVSSAEFDGFSQQDQTILRKIFDDETFTVAISMNTHEWPKWFIFEPQEKVYVEGKNS